QVRVDMGEPIFDPAQIPTTLPGRPPTNVNLVLPDLEELPTGVQFGLFKTKQFKVTCLSMGNPHCVTFVEEITDALVYMVGSQVERHPAFPRRTNVEFAVVNGPQEITMRVWERGSGETMACGTGACAVAVAGAVTGRTQRRATVHLKGGDLQLDWPETDNHV